jgi:hypothetical protein
MTIIGFLLRGLRRIGCYGKPQMSQPARLPLSRTASLVGGLLWACLAPIFVYADSALDKPGTAGFVLAVISIWLVGVVSLVLLLLGLAQLWPLGRDRLGQAGQAGIIVSALALAAMALGNGIELYAVTARGTESDIGHTIFLIAFLILILLRCCWGRSLFVGDGAPAFAGPVCSCCWRHLSESCSWSSAACCRRTLISASGPR